MEVFKYDWLMVAYDTDTRLREVVVNSRDEMERFYTAHKQDIWSGFNSRHYDQWITKAILCGFDPKEVSDWIIRDERPGWQFSKALNGWQLACYDVMQKGDRSLKVYECFMGHDIRESGVPFDIDRKLTDAEIAEAIQYCAHDVEECMEVFMRRAEEFDAQRFFIRRFGYPLSYYGKTKAQLAAEILGGNGKGKGFADEFDFPFIPGLQIRKYRHVMDWYRDKANQDYGKWQDADIAGVPHSLSWGGIHGARKATRISGCFILADVTAYYPAMQQAHRFGYRVMGKPENFEFIHGSNLEYKELGDKKARQPFKIMDNAISGQMKQRSSKLYDPMGNNAITVNGQLALVDLIEHLEGCCELIQSNTDGILIRIADEGVFDTVDDIVWDWEQRIGVRMEFDLFRGTVWQKDVNNYLLVDDKGDVLKGKGSWVKRLSPLDNDLPIVNRALVDFMVKGTPIEATVMGSDALMDFQMLGYASSKYTGLLHGGEPIREKTVRAFASLDPADGDLKWIPKATGKPGKVPGTPVHCFFDNRNVEHSKVPAKLDRQWYIDLAHERLAAFGY